MRYGNFLQAKGPGREAGLMSPSSREAIIYGSVTELNSPLVVIGVAIKPLHFKLFVKI